MTREQKIEKLNSMSKKESTDAKWRKRVEWNEKHAEALDDYIIIAARIAYALKQKGMSQAQFAEKLGVSPQALTRIIKAQQNLTLLTIRKMEQELGVHLIEVASAVEKTIIKP